MYVLGYEIDIYLVIVVAAGIFVFTIIWAMSGALRTKKHAPENKRVIKKLNQNKENGNGKLQHKISPEDSRGKALKETQKEETVPNSKSMPAEMPQKELGIKKLEEATEKDDEPNINPPVMKTEEDSNQDSGVQTIDSIDTEKGAPAPTTRLWEADQSAEDKSKVLLSSLKDRDGFMDLFEEDGVVDTATADLSALLVDVDLSTLGTLMEEVSQVLSKHDSELKRRHDYE